MGHIIWHGPGDLDQNCENFETIATLSFAIAGPYALWLVAKYILGCVDRYMKVHFFLMKKILKTLQACIFLCLKKNSKKSLKTSSLILLRHSIHNILFNFSPRPAGILKNDTKIIFWWFFDSLFATRGDRELLLNDYMLHPTPIFYFPI